MFTTSRYASRETRRFASTMAEEKGERYAARGKRTIADLAADARKRGEAEITVVEERGGKPAVLSRISVDELGRWKWAGETGV